jgi:hypothetical protein
MKWLVGFLLVSSVAQAAPGWATKGDTSDASGSTFICEGHGRNDEDALSAAHGICSDKICKLCGVEVESVLETKETLNGIDFQRKVVERCRRVRKSEPQVKYKSSDCGPDGCTAWIQIFYSTQTAKQECASYQKEDFADPAACEADIDTFRNVTGRTSAAYRQRREALDAALIHCEKIDVRPTPAILALDNKLLHGMDQFEVGSGALDGRYGSIWYSVKDPDVRLKMSEAKELNQRIRFVRDYVQSRELNLLAAEAMESKELDTPAGIERLRTALAALPAGKLYRAPDAHTSAIYAVEKAKTDASAIIELVLKKYPSAQIEYEMQRALSFFLRQRDSITPAQWEQLSASFKQRMCYECVRALLDTKDHGDPELRFTRFFEILDTVPENRRSIRTIENFMPERDALFVLALEPKLPPRFQGQFDWDYWTRLLGRQKEKTPERTAVLARLGKWLADGAADPSKERGFCISLVDRIQRFTDYGATDLSVVDQRICACLDGPLKSESESLVNKSELVDLARTRKLKCVSPAVKGR